MTRAKDVAGVIVAARNRDWPLFDVRVKCLIANERRSGREAVASCYELALGKHGASVPFDGEHALRNPPSGLEGIHNLLRSVGPAKDLDAMWLDPGTKQNVNRLLLEFKYADSLADAGLAPRHKVLLSGPPGCGKTSLAGAIAIALGCPIYAMQFENIVGSFLGETGQRLGKAFRFVEGVAPCVLLVDEIDVVASDRGARNEMGEIRRVVATLLTLIDHLSPHVVLVGTTNRVDDLDTAAKRRFDLVLPIEGLRASDSLAFLRDTCKRQGRSAAELGFEGVDASTLSHMSCADVEQLVVDAHRSFVLRAVAPEAPGVDVAMKGGQETKRP